jgi:hypothetical protein
MGLLGRSSIITTLILSDGGVCMRYWRNHKTLDVPSTPIEDKVRTPMVKYKKKNSMLFSKVIQ